MSTVDYSPLWYWVKEREAIRVRREVHKDPAPWTRDEILVKYRFCNVRREDDLVTRWVREHIRVTYAGYPHEWLMLCIARQINFVPTLDMLIAGGGWPNQESDDYPWLTHMETLLRRREAAGEKVYTGAYTITAPPTKGASKIEFTCRTVIGQLWRDRQKFADYLKSDWRSLQGMHALLKKCMAWGDFMSYQAVVDMRFTDLLNGARDVDTWAAAGPGTIRGLNRIHGRPVPASLSQEQALREMRAIHALSFKETDVLMDFSDVPNILCETDKYLRVKNGEGAPRATYVPGRGF